MNQLKKQFNKFYKNLNKTQMDTSAFFYFYIFKNFKSMANIPKHLQEYHLSGPQNANERQ